MRLLRSGVALIALAVPAVVAQAQEVSSAISGTVLSASGEPVAGAEVAIVHTPTGTRVTTTTGADGRFAAAGLRIGGPFTVSITAEGYQGQSIEGVNVAAGNTFNLTASLESSTSDATIVVSASSLRRSGVVSTGSISAFSAKDIAAITSVARDIRDVAARDPLTSFDPNFRGISIAGASARANRFTIDGVAVQDDFGLNLGGLPSLRGIVSLEAIGQLSIKTAPFDVGQGNFTGGAIDAVLKSGTNEYHGVAYGIIGGKGLTGRNIRGAIVPQALPFRDYGFFVSGPIIKDRLFVALNYEKLTEGNIVTANGITGEGFANNIPNIGDGSSTSDDRAIVNGIIATTENRYEYDPLDTFQQESERDRKISGKIDWNITEGQRLSFTYIDHFNSVPLPGGGSTNAPAAPNVGLQSNSYEGTESTKVYTGQLNSQWTDELSTELRVSYRDYVRGQVGYNDQGFAQLQVCTNAASITLGTGPTNDPYNCGNTSRVTLGTDTPRHSNALATNNLNFQFNMRYNAGAHRIKFQVEGSRQKVDNLFLFNSRGNFYFDSIADYNAGNANSVSFSNSLDGDPRSGGTARFTLYSYAFGLQDEWQVSPTFTALIGARFDGFSFDDRQITFNPFFTQRYGFRNNTSVDGVSVFQPRFGFNWKPDDRTRVSGGAGIFSGGIPLVLFSNSLANDGTRTNGVNFQREFVNGVATGNFIDLNNRTTDPAVQAQINAAAAAALNNVDGFGLQTNAVVNNYLANNTSSLRLASTNTVAPNFKMNSVVRANLTGEYIADLGFLGDGWVFRGDLAHTWNRNSYTMIDLRAIANGTLPDGRPRYQGIEGSAGNDFQLRSRTGGVSFIAAASISKEWQNGFSIQAAYTRSRITDFLSDTGGTTATGSYFVAVRDPNSPDIATSSLQVGNQVRLTLNYRHAFFGDYETNFQIFGLYRQGVPFSYTKGDTLTQGRGRVFGVTNVGRHLLYVPNVANLVIPTGTAAVNTQIDPIVQFNGTPAQLTAFRDFILNSELGEFQGQIAPRGIARNPDWYTVNLHFSQQVPLFVGKSRMTLFADVENFLNLLDDKFAFRQLSFTDRSQTHRLVQVDCLTTGGTRAELNQTCASYRYSNFQAPVFQNLSRSPWTLRIGGRVEF
ncbi:TonB-dependent receptor [Sandarakinorhabdus rubra]|uniref:TonB-dependent receptor n=1 Tax=Sandarakinorhabdus rubra TaxID=2672568 RepID=UPI0013DC2517|nr:carboxypeptidase regulatory-like domain-containing protein [Sandarakinorhabdus rubra]